MHPFLGSLIYISLLPIKNKLSWISVCNSKGMDNVERCLSMCIVLLV